MNELVDVTLLFNSGELIEAEKAALANLEREPNHIPSLTVIANSSFRRGDHVAAEKLMEQISQNAPPSVSISYNLALFYFATKRLEKACAAFSQAYDLSSSGDSNPSRELIGAKWAQSLLHLGNYDDAVEIYTKVGAIRPETAIKLASAVNDIDPTSLNDVEGEITIKYGRYKENAALVYNVGASMWRRGARIEDRRTFATCMLWAATLLQKDQEVADYYLEFLRAGYPIIDYRPRWDNAYLSARQNGKLFAEKIHADGVRRFEAMQSASPILSVWKPWFGLTGRIRLFATSERDTAPAQAWFEIRPSMALSSAEVRKVSARCVQSDGARIFHFESLLSDLSPGGKYDHRFTVATNSESKSSAWHPLSVNDCRPSEAKLSGADFVADAGAVLFGSIASSLAAARYHFEFGTGPTELTNTTLPCFIPPPVSGNVRDLAYRNFGNIIPRSTFATYSIDSSTASLGAYATNRPALRLIGPFAKDRNQLTGIGSHEMPLNFGWCHPVAGFEPETYKSMSIGAGIMDLRDAEITFSISAQGVQQKGSILTFWNGRGAKDEISEYWSQWSLTGHPFPDECFAQDRTWSKVTLKLPNDPNAWTYTGNNPREQGKRANRYRRLPINETLSCNNNPFVLIFNFGEERSPPLGTFDIFDISVRYRDYSVLSPAAGAELASWPTSSMADPSFLTDGSRGYDEYLWTSAKSPSLPLEFEWRLPRSVRVSRFQINQHPYYPSRDVEVFGCDAMGQWRLVWAGVMNKGLLGTGDVPFAYVEYAGAAEYVAIRLRILSGYHADRCGLDSFEVYGDGVQYLSDGQPCTVSEEIKDLQPGSTVFYRLVVESESGEKTHSETKSITLPLDKKPLILSAVPKIRPNNPRCIIIRGNAMGLETTISGELLLASGERIAGPSLNFGCQPTGRHIYMNLSDALPNQTGIFRIKARNLVGDATHDMNWPPQWQ